MTPFTLEAPILTERLVLRLLTLEDIDDVYDYQSDPDVVRYMLYEPRSREVVIEKLTEQMQAKTLTAADDYLQLAIEVPETPDARARVIGTLYFKLTSTDDETAEIGWALNKDYQGHGYAREAATAVLDLAFDTMKLHRVFAELDPRNDASVGLCLALGMRREAHFVEHMRFKGEWADTGIYGILDREWTVRPRAESPA